MIEKYDYEDKNDEELKRRVREYFQGIWVNSDQHIALCDFASYVDALSDFYKSSEAGGEKGSESGVTRRIDIVNERIKERRYKLPKYEEASSFLFKKFCHEMSRDCLNIRSFLNELSKDIRDHPFGY